MVRALVLRGVGAGALAGLIAFLFARIFAEPVIQAAIDYEGARDEAQQALNKAAGLPVEEAGPELFSRAVQGNLGIGLGMVLFGAGVGALFAVAFCLAWGRTGALKPRSLVMLTSLGCFTTLYLVPFVKYPANPPAIGHEDTISDRAGLYLVMVVGSVVASLIALWAGQRLAERLGNWNATLAGIGVFIVLSGLLMAVLPSLGQLQVNIDQYGNLATETPQPLRNPEGAIVFPGFDPDALYSFRLYSLAAQALLWTVLGLVFAPLADRVLGDRRDSAYREVSSPVV
ncbi:CbtA family protein [Pseudonocardia spinosispora]|uniref:CbtA family protein n=1 Tax=Pseudonocardia spinosispora TaxID=103441 RepID=UPI0003F6DB3D|nr:CbtA family protein [Pseudonocardia spinosispora]